MTADRATYVLPVPPSANQLYRVYRGRAIKSRAYRQWLEDAGAAILAQGRVSVPSPVGVSLVIVPGPGCTRGRDADNFLKPTLDLLRSAGVIAGDNINHVRELTVWVSEGGGPVGLSVRVAPLLRD